MRALLFTRVRFAWLGIASLMMAIGCQVYDPARLPTRVESDGGDAGADAGSDAAEDAAEDAPTDAATDAPSGFPEDDCIKRSNAGHDYYLCPTARSWIDARTHCLQLLNGDLVQIVDASENTFLAEGITAASWIGHSDSANEGLWTWSSNGVPFWQGTSTGATVLSQYANWSSGEPNATGDCGVLSSAGSLDEGDCAAPKPYVCEVSPDACVDDASKYDPGQCGCDNADTDVDGDGFAVCNDACDDDENKLTPGQCGCGTSDSDTDTDSDDDGVADCIDGCDDDGAKLEPGMCGCGEVETDTDGDLTADCAETCDDDPLKVAPDDCGCGNPDVDSDNDGTADCIDACPNHNPKIAAGQCGCSMADTDTDNDGTADCLETCPRTYAQSGSTRAPTRKIKNLTGSGTTSAPFGVGGTDLGIPVRQPDGKIAYVFGDTFEQDMASGPGWRSPVLLRSEPGFDGNGIDFTSAAGGQYAKQILSYSHTGNMTWIPSDVITIGGRMYLHYMVGGFNNVMWTQIAYSDDNGESWIVSNARWEANENNSLQQLWTWERGCDGFVYVMSTKFSRDQAIILHRVPETALLDKTQYEPWGYAGQWAWGNPATTILDGDFGELALRRVEDRWVLSWFNAGAYEITIKVFNSPIADLTVATTYHPIRGGNWGSENDTTVAQLYGGYIHPDSTLHDLHLIVSQWNTNAGWPYRAMEFVTGIE